MSSAGKPVLSRKSQFHYRIDKKDIDKLIELKSLDSALFLHVSSLGEHDDMGGPGSWRQKYPR